MRRDFMAVFFSVSNYEKNTSAFKKPKTVVVPRFLGELITFS